MSGFLVGMRVHQQTRNISQGGRQANLNKSYYMVENKSAIDKNKAEKVNEGDWGGSVLNWRNYPNISYNPQGSFLMDCSLVFLKLQ